MKTSVMEVHDMLSVLSVDEVEKRIGEVPGVESVTVNYAAGNATVRYDETRLEVADIKSAVCQKGHEPATPATPSVGDGHEGHAAPDAPPSTPVAAAPKPSPSAPSATPTPTSAAPKSASDAAAAPAAPAGNEQQDKTAPQKS
jgi:Cu2+-exporting ATPase